MIRRPPRSTQSRSSAASDVYKRQLFDCGKTARLLGSQPIKSTIEALDGPAHLTCRDHQAILSRTELLASDCALELGDGGAEATIRTCRQVQGSLCLDEYPTSALEVYPEIIHGIISLEGHCNWNPLPRRQAQTREINASQAVSNNPRGNSAAKVTAALRRRASQCASARCR